MILLFKSVSINSTHSTGGPTLKMGLFSTLVLQDNIYEDSRNISCAPSSFNLQFLQNSTEENVASPDPVSISPKSWDLESLTI